MAKNSVPQGLLSQFEGVNSSRGEYSYISILLGMRKNGHCFSTATICLILKIMYEDMYYFTTRRMPCIAA